MNPVKRHRVVRHAVPVVRESDSYSRTAIESAENEGWPPRGLNALARILRAASAPAPRWRRKQALPCP